MIFQNVKSSEASLELDVTIESDKENIYYPLIQQHVNQDG